MCIVSAPCRKVLLRYPDIHLACRQHPMPRMSVSPQDVLRLNRYGNLLSFVQTHHFIDIHCLHFQGTCRNVAHMQSLQITQHTFQILCLKETRCSADVLLVRCLSLATLQLKCPSVTLILALRVTSKAARHWGRPLQVFPVRCMDLASQMGSLVPREQLVAHDPAHRQESVQVGPFLWCRYSAGAESTSWSTNSIMKPCYRPWPLQVCKLLTQHLYKLSAMLSHTRQLSCQCVRTLQCHLLATS